MASRARQSTAQPTPRGFRGTQPAPKDVQYEPPSFPLTAAAQRELANLKRTHDLTRLNKSLEAAEIQLTEAAVEINERLFQKGVHLEKALKKDRSDADEDTATFHASLQQKHDVMKEKITGMTGRMEGEMRKLRDGERYVAIMKESLDKSAEDARNNASTQASTQNMRTQRPRRYTRGQNGEDDEDEEMEDDIPDFQPTNPTAGNQPVEAPLDIYKTHMEEAKTQYQSYPLFDRYSEHNPYVSYRRLVHDAMHPNDDVPLPPKEDWFNDDGTVAPVGFTKTRVEGEEESDDDLVQVRAKISTKCPLTLQEFREPLTSKKCNHSFEKTAILDMLSRSAEKTAPQPGLPRGQQCIRCPASACSHTLVRADLEVDRYVVGKIKKLQKAKQMEELEDSEDEEEGNGKRSTQGVRIDSDDADVDAEVQASINLKAEPKTQATGLPPSQPPRPSQVVDIPSEDEEEEEDEDVEMED